MKNLGLYLPVIWLLSGCCIQQWTPGALMANGSATEVLGNVNGRLYSMNGFERISRAELKAISLVHILLFEPDVETRGGGSGLRTDCLGAVETITWKLGDYQNGPLDLQDPHFTVQFDGGSNKVQIGNRVYDAMQGNLFVVWLDQKWEPRVKQVGITVVKQEPLCRVLEKFKQALPSENDVQAATLYSQMPGTKR